MVAGAAGEGEGSSNSTLMSALAKTGLDLLSPGEWSRRLTTAALEIIPPDMLYRGSRKKRAGGAGRRQPAVGRTTALAPPGRVCPALGREQVTGRWGPPQVAIAQACSSRRLRTRLQAGEWRPRGSTSCGPVRPAAAIAGSPHPGPAAFRDRARRNARETSTVKQRWSPEADGSFSATSTIMADRLQ